MAGVKGRSGGARPGAGRPRKPPETIASVAKRHDDPAAFLRDVMNDAMADAKLRVDAAKALMPYVHAKKGEGGKKDARAEAAAKVATGRFGAVPPPLRAVK